MSYTFMDLEIYICKLNCNVLVVTYMLMSGILLMESIIGSNYMHFTHYPHKQMMFWAGNSTPCGN